MARRTFFLPTVAAILSLVIIGPACARDAPAGNEPARPLTGRGLQNLHAFARLYGVIAYFHPSDAVRATTDWVQLSMAGVQRAEGAKSPQELAEALRAIFSPLAPTARIYLTGAPLPPASPWLDSQNRSGFVLTAFRYNGWPFGSSNAYRREVLVPAAGPEPAYTADLGGGVSAVVPLTLYRDGTGTSPHESAAPLRPDKPEGFLPSGDDRTTRLADVIYAWNVFQHFYPYFDIVPVDWQAELDKALRQAAIDKDRIAFRATLRRMVAALHDGHGRVHLTTGPEFDLPLDWEWAEGQIVITAVGSGVAGPVRGDILLKIDGRAIGDVVKRDARQTSAATEQWKRVVIAADLLQRDRGDPVRLTVRRAGGRTADIALMPVKYVAGSTPTVAEAPSLDAAKEVEPGIWYIDLSRKDGDAVEALAPKLAEAKGIVFDLRKFPANNIWRVLSHLSDHPLWEGRFLAPVYTRPDRQGVTYDDRSGVLPPEPPRFHGRIAFLCGGESISFRETILTVVADYHLGEIVGEPSAGTNGVIAPFTLPGDYWINWTGMRVERMDGSRFMGVGIAPTVAVHRTPSGIRAGRDEVLEKGIAIVGGKANPPP